MPHPLNTTPGILVSPQPPVVADELAHIGAGLRFARNPTAFFQELRQQYGDTYLVDVFGYKLFCLFSPQGLHSLYQLEEDKASFGFATFDMMGFKTPTEIFMDADIQLFYELLKHKRLPGYIATINDVMTLECERLGEQGEIDLFDHVRSMEQRIGFGLWIGPDAVTDGVWQDLKADFDALSQETAFVSPESTLETLVSGKQAERAALQHLHRQLQALWQARDEPGDNTFALLMARFADPDPAVTLRKTVHNLVNANQGFLSNLYAALAWTLSNLLQHPRVLSRVNEEFAAARRQFGDGYLRQADALSSLQYVEQVFMESIRLAQRSITLRKVLQPVEVDDGTRSYTVNPGCYITTMLSVTNTEADDMGRFDPDRYEGRRLRALPQGMAAESISTFGHGRHACPAQNLSHAMCKIVLGHLMEQFTWELPATAPEPAHRQMGGVARPEQPLYLRYRRQAASAPASSA